MTQVILQPAAGPEAQEHYQNTIARARSLVELGPYLSPSDRATLARLCPSGEVRIWGAVPGKNTPLWERMQPGDQVLFYQDGRFVTVCTLIHKTQNQSLARYLWSSDQKGRSYEFIFFLDQLRDIDIKYSDLQRVAQYGPAGSLPWLVVLPPEASQRVMEAFGLADPVPQPVPPEVQSPEPPTGEVNSPAPLAALLDLTNLPESDLQELESLLTEKRQVILEGPPGSGKTYVAMLFARYFTSNPLSGEPNEQVRIVQFHQSYGYEDFIQGIRPETTPAGQLGYTLREGAFNQLCDLARAGRDRRFVMVIDEINRGNVAAVLGAFDAHCGAACSHASHFRCLWSTCDHHSIADHAKNQVVGSR